MVGFPPLLLLLLPSPDGPLDLCGPRPGAGGRVPGRGGAAGAGQVSLVGGQMFDCSIVQVRRPAGRECQPRRLGRPLGRGHM